MMTQQQLKTQITKLDQTSLKLKSRDSAIFNSVVSSIQKHDMPHATVYANELNEVRKMNKMVTQSKLALEQIALRLNTVSELGDVVVTLTPAMGVIKDIQSDTSNLKLNISRAMQKIDDIIKKNKD